MKRFLKVSVLLAVMGLLMTSCNCYNKMEKRINEVNASANPTILTLKGQTVDADVRVSFPAKYFHKKAVFKITPVLTFDGGEIAGAPKYLQGEKIKDNYTVISHANGGSYTQNVAFPYDSRADMSTLNLRVDAKCKNGLFVNIANIPVAQGISTVQNSADWSQGLSIIPDEFKRVTTISQTADLVYDINSSKVKQSALTASQIKLLEDFVRENSDKDRVTLGNIYAKGYASPDGPQKFNDELSSSRSQTGQTAISKQLSDVKATYDAAAYGEDWDGFKSLVAESNIKDKDLILQVLNMYTSSAQRDQEIRNMTQVFEVLKTDVLPQLRRTQFVANADIQGKTDAELRSAAQSSLNSLNLEEMLFAATLFDDNATKAKIYKAAADKYNDVRAYNNYGTILAAEGEYAAAKKAFDKAASIKSSSQISNNLGVLALSEGNYAEAKKYSSSMQGEGKALAELADGNYAAATRGLSGYNLAVAEFLNGNMAKAKSALGNINTADADYLRAVIASREGDSTTALANLKNAFSKDASLKAKAKKDVELAKLHSMAEFKAL